MQRPSIVQEQRAITLVELLIAIGLVAIMAALILPAIGSLSGAAKTATCMNNMRQVYTALMSYAAEHNQYMPPGRFIPMQEMSTVSLKAHLEPHYIGRIPNCPTVRLNPQGLAELAPGETEAQELAKKGSYSFNGHFTRTKINNMPGKYWGYPANYLGSHQFLFLTEGHEASVMWNMSQFNTVLNGLDVYGFRRAPRDHGRKRLNFMFLDGHGETLAPRLNGSSYEWDAHFDSSGADGKYIPLRQIWNEFED